MINKIEYSASSVVQSIDPVDLGDVYQNETKMLFYLTLSKDNTPI